MSKRKIINDPIYGLVNFHFDLLYDIIDHAFFQRLRRISQMGLSNYVYPGATHSRFAHALGALHLMQTSIETLRHKGVYISDEEYRAVCIAILLHDIGHGPFSHALEKIIVPKSHEEISLDLMHHLNKEFEGKLDLAIQIFKGEYPKKYLTQLVSSQLDMDRMDYLTRDSYYSGVAEGVIGYKRIIAMLNVSNNELVVEEKGIYSIEKFLVARHIMYWQVYLHKASLSIELMLKAYVNRYKALLRKDSNFKTDNLLEKLLFSDTINPSNYLSDFCGIDDADVFHVIKRGLGSPDKSLQVLSDAILNRKLFKIKLSETAIADEEYNEVRRLLLERKGMSNEELDVLLMRGTESSSFYTIKSEEIKFLQKSGKVVPASSIMDINIQSGNLIKHYLCYPRI